MHYCVGHVCCACCCIINNYCAVIIYTGESEGAMPKRGSGIEGRQTYVRYSAWHLVNSLNLVALILEAVNFSSRKWHLG